MRDENCICNMPGVPGAVLIYNSDDRRFQIQKCDGCDRIADDELAGDLVFHYLTQRNEVA